MNLKKLLIIKKLTKKCIWDAVILFSLGGDVISREVYRTTREAALGLSLELCGISRARLR